MTSVIGDAASLVTSIFSSKKVHDVGGNPEVDEDLDHQVRGRTSLIKQMKRRVGAFVATALAEYGPPYEYDDYYKGALLFECSQRTARSLEIHRLLNAKLDPNDVDKDELNFTPMHWCARHCHINPMRMLVRAKAHVNVSNEFGQSPLSVCCMMKQTMNKITVQMEMVEYLLDQGANIEIVDKGGLSPLDYAAHNKNFPLVQLLLDYGATVRRENKLFAAQRAPLLDSITDKQCYKRMERRLDKETAGDRKREAAEEAARIQKVIDDANQAKKQYQLDKAEKRLEEEEKRSRLKIKDEILRKKIEKLSGELNEEKAAKAVAVHSMGSWNKGDDRHWIWLAKKAPNSHIQSHNHIYNEGLKLAIQVKERRSVSSVNKRWEAITGTKLEVKWDSMAGFDEIIKVDRRNRLGASGSIDDDNTAVAKIDFPLDIKDENDKELEGEDLGDFDD